MTPRGWTTSDALPHGDPWQQYVAAMMRWTHHHQEQLPTSARCGIKQYMALHEFLATVMDLGDRWWPTSIPFHTIPLACDETLPAWGYVFAHAAMPVRSADHDMEWEVV